MARSSVSRASRTASALAARAARIPAAARRPALPASTEASGARLSGLHYLRSGDNTAAVAAGLQRTGGIITTAALLLVVVIGAFSLSGITFIKLIGVAMAIAIVVDATVVRALLVPALVSLFGRWNWWLPDSVAHFMRGKPSAVPPAERHHA